MPIDSNVVGLRITQETSFGVLSGSDVWRGYEPNSFTDFGGEIATVAREFIADDRQRKKGVVTDLDASGGFDTDFTQDNMIYLLQGFFVRNWIEKPTSQGRNSAAVTLSAIDSGTKQYRAASGLDGFGLIANHLVLAENNTDSTNNGLKTVTTVASGAVTVSETLVSDGAPAATAMLTAVGYQFAAGTVDVDVTASTFPRFVRASGSVSFATLGLAVGDWVYIGGDGATNVWLQSVNNGWARIRAIAATYLEFDKTDAAMLAETGSAGTPRVIRIFFGHRINNAAASSDITKKYWQLERTLGNPGGGVQAEYLVGQMANSMTINIPQADKIVLNLGFVGKDHTQRTAAEGVKAGTRPSIVDRDAFNTSSDFSRLRVAPVSTTSSFPTALFAYLTELTIDLSNNVTPLKAIANLGAIGLNLGMFEVGGSATAYFETVAAIQAVRNNTSVTIDWVITKNNAGWALDIPLTTLGDGRANIELNQPVTLPLNVQAAKDSTLGYTMSMTEFKYLPTVAM
jgi:hypothetical protein